MTATIKLHTRNEKPNLSMSSYKISDKSWIRLDGHMFDSQISLKYSGRSNQNWANSHF